MLDSKGAWLALRLSVVLAYLVVSKFIMKNLGICASLLAQVLVHEYKSPRFLE